MVADGKIIRACASALVLGVCLCAAGQSSTVQSFPLDTVAGLDAQNVKVEPAEYLGRKAIRLTMDSQDGGLVLLKGSDLQDGTIEADMAVKVMTPPGVRMPGFTGIAFRAKPDGSSARSFIFDRRMRSQRTRACAITRCSTWQSPDMAGIGCGESGRLFTRAMRTFSRRHGST